MAPLTPSIRLALFVCGLAAGSVTLTTLTYAQQSCGDDLKRLSEKRQAALDRLNNLVKAGKGKPVDPALFCGTSSGLNSTENMLLAYMEKNKDWCSIPDDAIASFKANHAKSLSFAAKACAAAAQMKKQQASGAPQVAPLPAGPL